MNHYEVLGIRRNASQEDIKKAYKNLVKKYHPDIYAGDKTFAEKKTAQINVAYDVLCNPESRQAYDAETFPSTTYSYTPPETKTSYDDYKHKYSSTNQSTYRRDGSEHDYSTYVNYGRPYTDYHRSKTPNSNYSPRKDTFSEKIIRNIDNLSFTNKKKLFIIGIIIYLFLVIYCIVQTISILTPRKTIKNTKTETQTQSTTENTVSQNDSTTNNYITETPSTSDNTSIEITTHSNNSIMQYHHGEIDLYDYFTENELQTMYIYFLEYTQYEISYEDFKNLLVDYLKSSNY